MAIDPNIALSVRGPQFESPINAMRNAMEIGAYQNKMQQQQQALQQQQQLRNFLSTANLGDPIVRNQLNAYDPSGETFKNVEAGYETRGKSEMDTFKLALAKYSEFRNRLGGLASTNASRDEVISEVRNAVQQGLLTPELGKHFEDTLPTDPVQLQTRLIRGARENASPEQIVAMFAPKIESQDTGGGGRLLRVNAYENKAEVIPGSEFTKTLSPDEQGRINREFNPAKVAHVTTDNQGNVHFFNAQGAEIRPGAGVGAGKPSAQVEKERRTSRELKGNLDSAITELEAALKPDGLLSRATGSGFGSAIDKASAAVGRATEGSVAIGQLQPIFDMVLKLVPRFEGPQSDADTRSYREAAGNLANPSTPNPVKKAAATTILRLMKSRRNQFGVKDETGNVVTGEQPAAGGDDLDALVERHRTK